DQLSLSRRVLAGETVETCAPASVKSTNDVKAKESPAGRIAALIAVDPLRNGLGIARSLAEQFQGRSVLQATLERLGESQTLDSIVLIAQRGSEIESLINQNRIKLPVEIEWRDESPFGPEHEAIAVARLFTDACWRGGIAGASVYDEALCPQMM